MLACNFLLEFVLSQHILLLLLLLLVFFFSCILILAINFLKFISQKKKRHYFLRFSKHFSLSKARELPTLYNWLPRVQKTFNATVLHFFFSTFSHIIFDLLIKLRMESTIHVINNSQQIHTFISQVLFTIPFEKNWA